MIEGLVGLGIGVLLGGTAVHYTRAAGAKSEAPVEVAAPVVAFAAGPAPEPEPMKRRVRTFVCHDGRRIRCHDREEQFHAPPGNVAYTIDGEEAV